MHFTLLALHCLSSFSQKVKGPMAVLEYTYTVKRTNVLICSKYVYAVIFVSAHSSALLFLLRSRQKFYILYDVLLQYLRSCMTEASGLKKVNVLFTTVGYSYILMLLLHYIW